MAGASERVVQSFRREMSGRRPRCCKAVRRVLDYKLSSSSVEANVSNVWHRTSDVVGTSTSGSASQLRRLPLYTVDTLLVRSKTRAPDWQSTVVRQVGRQVAPSATGRRRLFRCHQRVGPRGAWKSPAPGVGGFTVRGRLPRTKMSAGPLLVRVSNAAAKADGGPPIDAST